MGRNPLLSDIAIAKIIKEVQMGDLGKDSLESDDDWNEFIKAKIIIWGFFSWLFCAVTSSYRNPSIPRVEMRAHNIAILFM